MPKSGLLKKWAVILIVLAFCGVRAEGAATGQAQVPSVKKPITYDVYDSWRSIQGTQISRDGTWLVYALVPQEGDGELVALNLKTNIEHRSPRGKDPAITADSRFVVFTITPPQAEVDKAKKEKKKPEEQPKPGLGIMNLATGEVVAAERVKNFKLPKESGAFVAYLLEPPLKKPEEKPADKKEEEAKKPEEKKEELQKPEEKDPKKKKEKKKEPGTDLVIRETATGKETTVPEVVEYAWNKNGAWLAYSVSSKTPENDGAFVRNTVDGTTRAILKGLGNYKKLTFDEQGGQLAFVSDRDDYKADTPAFKLFHWDGKAEAAAELVSSSTKNFSAGMAVSEHGRVEFSKDGSRLFFGISPAPKPEPEDEPEPVKVDIWHWKDPLLQPMQKVRAEDEKKRSFLSVMHLKDRRFIRLASPDMPEMALSDDATVALGSSNIPHLQLISWDGNYSDYYFVNVQTGARRKILEKAYFGATLSPANNYVFYYDDRDKAWFSYSVKDDKKVNLTGKLNVRFEDETWDTPNQPPPYGNAGWSEGDKSVLLYDRYDIWEVSPDGASARMITRGAGRNRQLTFRYRRLDPEEKAVPLRKPLLLSITDDRTKATGYSRISLNETKEPVQLAMQEKLFGAIIKAKEAETLVFTLQTFQEFPDLWMSDGNFSGMRKVSNANPQQAEYLWGTAELSDYRNRDGKPLSAILYKPEDFDPAKKYPLMVYIYEELTNGLHRHIVPSPGTGINYTRYVSNGYVLLLPDIVYDTGYPGESAMKCVLPAIQKVVDLGFIDPKRIGIQGHSWGGYQISYMITRTNIFAAVEAGASVVNMVSAYGGIRWGTGMSRAFQYEKTQSRIGAPPWERSLQYIENSPIFWAEKVRTPYLTIHNDEDDAVPWYQGIEFFTALRRLGKEAYMLNYNGEKHGLRERENQKHWTVHLDEFFDHYLKGAPRPEWMEKGVPYLERGKRDVNLLFKKATEKKVN